MFIYVMYIYIYSYNENLLPGLHASKHTIHSIILIWNKSSISRVKLWIKKFFRKTKFHIFTTFVGFCCRNHFRCHYLGFCIFIVYQKNNILSYFEKMQLHSLSSIALARWRDNVAMMRFWSRFIRRELFHIRLESCRQSSLQSAGILAW